MYHIPKDKRALRSAGLIGDGLLACLAEKPLDSVTITDVHRACGVSRATFYRLFDTVSDVLAYRSDMMFARMLSRNATLKGASQHDMIVGFFRSIMHEDDLIEAIIRNGRYDILLATHLRYKDELASFIPAGEDVPDDQLPYTVGILSAAMCSFWQTWVDGGKVEGPEELYERVRTGFGTIARMYALTGED